MALYNFVKNDVESRNKVTSGKSGWTRFVGWLNNHFNPTHNWMDYESAPDSSGNVLNKIGSGLSTFLDNVLEPNTINSLINTFTGAHLTGAQLEGNELSMQNMQDQYQRQVAGMQQAGLNPALMYDNGSSGSTPTVQGNVGTMSMSDIMSAMLLDKQARLLDSQANKTDAETDKIGAETEQIQLINKYYPQVTEANLKKVLSEIGVNETKVKEMLSQVDLNKLDADLKEIQKIINKAQADESSAYFRATRELAEAQTTEAKEKANEAKMRAFMAELEGNFMNEYGAKMGSSEWIAIASAITSVFGIDLEAFGKSPFAGLYEQMKDWLTRGEQGKGGSISPTSNQSGPYGNSR